MHRAPVFYDPAAGSIPSRWLNELLIPSLGSAEMADEFIDDFAAAWVGGSLEPFVFLLIGAADSGKSQLAEMLRALHGQPHWCALSARNVGDKFGSSFLAGPVRVVSFTDAKGNALTGEVGELVKSTTGGDYREDRGPHAQLLVAIQGDKIFLMTSNSCPKVDLDDDVAAWERRLRPHRFNCYPVEKRIPDFGKVLLREEGPIILNRLIDGARRRIRLQLDGKRPSMLPQMKELMDEILRRSCLCASYCESRITAEHGCQINRLAALRMAEERGIVLECVRHGLQSEGFLLFQQSAGGAFGDSYHSYQRRLFAEDAARGFAFIDLCRQRYDVVLMNPPFGESSERCVKYFDR
ncbi:MAG: hypothetical protein ACRDBP_12660, partial [Luteolibacter sp.]